MKQFECGNEVANQLLHVEKWRFPLSVYCFDGFVRAQNARASLEVSPAEGITLEAIQWVMEGVDYEVLSPTIAISKLGKALLVTIAEVQLLKGQVEGITVAEKYKQDINRLKRQVAHISRQAGLYYVSTARKAVRHREALELEKKERAEGRKRKREEKKKGPAVEDIEYLLRDKTPEVII